LKNPSTHKIQKKKEKPAFDKTYPPRGPHKTQNEAAVSYPIPHPPKTEKKQPPTNIIVYFLSLIKTVMHLYLG